VQRYFIIKIKICFLFLLLTTISGTCSVYADHEITRITESSDVIEVLSHSYYVSVGYSSVVGEVQNIGSQNLEYVELTVTFYDASNNVISTSFTFVGATFGILKPGDKAPFTLSSFPDENLAVDHYKVVVADHMVTSVSPYRELEVKGVTAGTELGYYNIQGEVENTGSVDAT